MEGVPFICLMHFPQTTCFNSSLKMAVSQIFTFLSKDEKRFGTKKLTAELFVE